MTLLKFLLLLRAKNRGQTLVEYSLIIAFIVILAVSVMASLGGTVRGMFSNDDSQIQAAEASR
jgi:Flp pilus assembly pilin Flp